MEKYRWSYFTWWFGRGIRFLGVRFNNGMRGSNGQENCVAGINGQLHFFIGYTGLLEDKKRAGEIIPTDKKNSVG